MKRVFWQDLWSVWAIVSLIVASIGQMDLGYITFFLAGIWFYAFLKSREKHNG